MPKINLINPLFQSPYVYLQVAGSDGSDGSASGFHLRWDFLRTLGLEHLPKGNLSGTNPSYPSTIGFNKNNDFVKIYRIPYNNEYTVKLDFAQSPTSLTESNSDRFWHYNDFIPVSHTTSNKTSVIVSFVNTDMYDTVRAQTNPLTNPLLFLQQYTDVVEVKTVGKLLFKGVFELGIVNESPGVYTECRVETVSANHELFDAPSDLDKYFISCRKRIAVKDTKEARTFLCENISSIRFNTVNAFVSKLTLSTYQDHIIGENGPSNGNGNFTFIKDFSLDDGQQDSNAEVFRRLEDIPKYVIDKKWPKYNNIDPITGEFTVSVQNYKDRWQDRLGLKEAVIKYLDLSKTDPKAIDFIPSDDANDEGLTEISVLDMLKLISLDFHAARMLGLGHIDLSKGGVSGPKDGGLDKEVIINYINSTSNSSQNVRNYLLERAPNSEPVLIAAINRPVPLSPSHLQDVLNATPNLDDSVLLSAILRNPSLPPSNLQNLLVNNSPLSDSILLACINRSVPLPPSVIQSIINENNPLSNEILLALINRSVALPPSNIQNIMVENSPLSDDVLISLLVRSTPLPPSVIKSIFEINTPLSPEVRTALINRNPPLPNNTLNAILNSTFVGGNFKKNQFIYVMEYSTITSIEDFVPNQTTTHLFMSLPTSQKDYRLPPVPVLKPVSYGLFLNNATASPTQLTDDNGYTPYADERFINIKRNSFLHEKRLEAFYFSRNEFCICNQSLPIGYGLEYKSQIESIFRKPEINHDSEFLDHNGTPETIFIPEMGKELVFNHQETEEGIHDYALYSVNWFSRASDISNIQSTDYTKFVKRNTILPPFNLAVQLIQEESPLIFTTLVEQEALTNMTSLDKTLVRTTFDWNYNHNKAYQFADYAEVYFRKNLPDFTRGKVTNVTVLNNRKVSVETSSFQITSTNPSQTIQPNIVPSNVSRFIGSTFVSNNLAFIVEGVQSSGNGDNPIFIVQQIRQTSTTDVNNNNVFTVTENFISPEIDDLFIVTENLAAAENWETKLSKRIYLEHFHTIEKITIQNSDNPFNDGSYTVKSVSLVSGNTKIELVQELKDDSIIYFGEVLFTKRIKVISNSASNQTFTVEGDATNELSANDVFEISASNNIDNSYTIVNIVFDGVNTVIEVLESFTDVYHSFYLNFKKMVVIDSINTTSNTITILEDYTTEIIPVYREVELTPNGEEKLVNIGGISGKASILEYNDKDSNGNLIPNSRTGIYEITFDNYQLPPHIDETVDWYRGIIRIMENSTFLPTTLEPDRTTPIMKVLQVWDIDNSGISLKVRAFDSTLQFDPVTFNPINEYVPIQSNGFVGNIPVGNLVDVNFHPSYRVYFTQDVEGTNNFEKFNILPQIGEGSRQTFMSIRAIDSKENPEISSRLTPPVILMAQEIVEPVAPGIPIGPAFATRPDYYGKSTYTFDTQVDTTGGRVPHMLLFFRANERRILDQLYKPETVREILEDLANLESPDKDYFAQRWNDLVSVSTDGSNLFKQYVIDGYRFPIPDNDAYSLPTSPISAPVFPFDGVTPPGDASLHEIVVKAIEEAFLPLTEQPVIFQYLNEGKQTSGVAPKIRDINGQILDPAHPEFNPCPMAVKYDESGETFVRFTDYTLDGAAKNFYFYYGVEMTNQLKISPKSLVSGPILLVNASPAENPTIKKVTAQLANPSEEITPAVLFEINDYIEAEGIAKIDLYRAITHQDALSVRTMEKVKTVEVGQIIADNFENDDFPLFGDSLFYRIIALRRIINEEGLEEYVPSKPSNIVLTNIVDNINPLAPKIISQNGITTSTELQNVILTWKSTCYNGTYRLQKMSDAGTWQTFYEVKSNDENIQYPPIDINTNLPDFVNFDKTAVLSREDEDGNPIYHRFRVQVENSSGLLNIDEENTTLATGCFDLAVYESYVTFADGNGLQLSAPPTGVLDQGFGQPLSFTFTGIIPTTLVAGHSSFNKITVKVVDDLNNSHSIDILTNTGTATFNHGDGGLVLDSSNPNRTYTISTTLYSDYCTSGATKKYVVNYASGPCFELSKLESIVDLLDANGNNLQAFTSQQIVTQDNPGSFTFTDIIDYTALGQAFSSIDVTITDSQNNNHTASITTQNGSVTFNNGDGNLVLNNSITNQNYQINILVKTLECTQGQLFSYELGYNYSACNVLTTLENILSYKDGNNTVLSVLTDSAINEGINHPNGSIEFTDIIGSNLPIGHTFDRIEILLSDNLNNSFSATINTIGGSVIINNGDGDLVLDASNPNGGFNISVQLFTDLCQNGAYFFYIVDYTYTIVGDLEEATSIVSFSDSEGNSFTPLSSQSVNSLYPTTLNFTDIISANLPNGDTFDRIEITVNDLIGGAHTKTITSALGSVTFNQGDGGLVLDNTNPSRTYIIIVMLFTSSAIEGVKYVYQLNYQN